jgi:hypothetical protein
MEAPEQGTAGDLPTRISADGRVATWNPGLTRSTFVVLRIRSESGERSERTTMNSGRARVREREAIESVYAMPPHRDSSQTPAEA